MVDIGNVLAVNLEARINKLEREMKRASDVSAGTFDKIERRSKQSAQRLEQNMARAGEGVRKSFIGMDKLLLGGLATGGLVAFGQGVRHIIGDVADLGEQAKRAGVSLKAFQEWKYVAEQNTIPLEAMSGALKEMSVRAFEFSETGKGRAAEAFARLGMSPADVKKRLADPSALLLELTERTRKLGSTAAGIGTFDKLFGAGAGEKMVSLLGRSNEELGGMIQKAHDLGLVLNDDLVSGAAELDAKFNAVATTVGTALKTAIVEASLALERFIGRFQAFNQQSTNALKARMKEIGLNRVAVENSIMFKQGAIDRGEAGWLNLNAGAFRAQIEGQKAELAEFAKQEKEILDILDLREPITWPPAGSAPTTPDDPPATPPNAPRGGTARNPYAELVAHAGEFIAQQRLEQQTLGMTAEAASRLRQQHELLNAAQRAGLQLTPEQRAEIEQLGAAMAAAEEQTRKLTEAQEGAKQAGEFVAGGLTDAFSDIITGAGSATDAIKSLTDALIKALVQAALLGSGPLGGLTGGVGLFSGLGFAEGGYTGFGGKHEPAGIVHRGEVVWSQDDVARHGGPALVDAMRRLPRFADGGVVGGLPSVPRATIAAPENVISISAPITVNGSAGTPDQNTDLAKKMRREMEAGMRSVVADELRKQTRVGNVLNTRSR